MLLISQNIISTALATNNLINIHIINALPSQAMRNNENPTKSAPYTSINSPILK